MKGKNNSFIQNDGKITKTKFKMSVIESKFE